MGEEGRREANMIPVLDLEEIPIQHTKLKEVCEEWGYFRIVNHGVPLALMSEMKRVSRSLLDLPVEVKKRSVGEKPRSGYIGHDETNPIYESLGLYDWASPGAVALFCSQLDASPHQREIVKKYVEAVSELALKVADKVARAMGLKGNDYFKEWHEHFRMNKYSFTSETVGSLGLEIHTDPVFLSILQDDEVVGGLEVARSSGSFIAVDPCPGSFVVLLGDMAVAWSNGRLRSVEHCVQCKVGAVRISTGGFMRPPEGFLIEAPADLVDCHHPRLYVPFTFDEYKQLRSSKKMKNDGALSFFLAQYENGKLC